jgi:hypothetical protein
MKNSFGFGKKDLNMIQNSLMVKRGIDTEVFIDIARR